MEAKICRVRAPELEAGFFVTGELRLSYSFRVNDMNGLLMPESQLERVLHGISRRCKMIHLRSYRPAVVQTNRVRRPDLQAGLVFLADPARL